MFRQKLLHLERRTANLPLQTRSFVQADLDLRLSRLDDLLAVGLKGATHIGHQVFFALTFGEPGRIRQVLAGHDHVGIELTEQHHVFRGLEFLLGGLGIYAKFASPGPPAEQVHTVQVVGLPDGNVVTLTFTSPVAGAPPDWEATVQATIDSLVLTGQAAQ